MTSLQASIPWPMTPMIAIKPPIKTNYNNMSNNKCNDFNKSDSGLNAAVNLSKYAVLTLLRERTHWCVQICFSCELNNF